MSEKINFIPASELPEAQGDTVDVLCVEDGKMKRKSANGLGGGGGLVVFIAEEFLNAELSELWGTEVYNASRNGSPEDIMTYEEGKAAIKRGGCIAMAFVDDTSDEGEGFDAVFCAGGQFAPDYKIIGVFFDESTDSYSFVLAFSDTEIPTDVNSVSTLAANLSARKPSKRLRGES